MSVDRDRNQKVKLVVVQGNSGTSAQPDAHTSTQAQSPRGEVKPSLKSSRVIKAEDLNQSLKSPIAQVSSYVPAEMIAKRIPSPSQALSSPHHAIEGLKQNLVTLNQLHSRLHFMLKEIEELVHE